MDEKEKDALYAMFLFDAAIEQRILDALIRVFEAPLLEGSDGAKLKKLLIDKLDIARLVGEASNIYRANLVSDAKQEIRRKLNSALKDMT